MAEVSRRDMLGAAAAGGVVATATGTETFGQGQPPFGPTPAPLAGSELPSFRFQLGAVAPKRWDGGWAKEATVAEFPVSQALAGVLMSLAPGGLARTALARQRGGMGLCHKRPMPRDHHQPRRPVADRRLQCRRRLVFPARLRPFYPGHRLGRLSVRAGVRQRLFLGVRHVQHQRLDWAHAARVLAKYFGGGRSRRLQIFPNARSISPRDRYRRRCPPIQAPGSLDNGPLTHRYRLLAHRRTFIRAGTNRLVSQHQFPISTTVTGALMQIKPGALREPHWHPNATNGSTTSLGARA